MLKLSVNQFISHLPIEKQGSLLVTKESFLDYLRTNFHKTDYLKRNLIEAARKHASGEMILVDCIYEEREAAKALIYAYKKLADTLKARGKVKPAKKTFKRYVNKNNKHVTKSKRSSSLRFPLIKTTINGQTETIEQYPLDITWTEATSFQQSNLYTLPEVTTNEHFIQVSQTAHFGKASKQTGWTDLYIDNQSFGKVRCWL